MKENIDFETLEELFVAWRQEHAQEENSKHLDVRIPKEVFLPDGIICKEKYDSAQRRILFIAKEGNCYKDDTLQANRERVKREFFWLQSVAFGESPSTSFSCKLAMLTNALLSGNYKITQATQDYSGVQSVAFMNLNKRGGFNWCKWSQLNAYVEKYSEFIKREIAIIKPNIILCCGAGTKWLMDKHGITVPENSAVLSIYHPGYPRVSNANRLKQLKDAVSGINGAKDNSHL